MSSLINTDIETWARDVLYTSPPMPACSIDDTKVYYGSVGRSGPDMPNIDISRFKFLLIVLMLGWKQFTSGRDGTMMVELEKIAPYIESLGFKLHLHKPPTSTIEKYKALVCAEMVLNKGREAENIFAIDGAEEMPFRFVWSLGPAEKRSLDLMAAMYAPDGLFIMFSRCTCH
jgi:hypothetical protein